MMKNVAINYNIYKLAPFLLNVSYIYDESIWLPNEPNNYNNLIIFKIQLMYNIEYLRFGLLFNEDSNQETIFY